MYKKITQIASVSLGLFMLTSCAAYFDYDIKVNSVDSIDYSGTFAYKDDASSKEVLALTAEQLEKDMEIKDFEAKDFKKEGLIGKTYIFKNLTPEEYKTIDSTFTLNKSDGKMTFTTGTPGDNDSDPEFNELSITMPGKIITAEGSTSIEGKTATWNINDYDKGEIVIVSNESSFNPLPVIGAGVVVLLGVGGYMYVRKNKHDGTKDLDQSNSGSSSDE